MEEFSKSIKAFLYERSSSPLFGAFVVAWLGWNYRAIATLFSEETLADKFLIIDRFYKSEPIFGFHIWGQFIHGLLIPAAIASAYIFIYPILAKPVYKYSLKKQQELRKIKQEEENLRLLTAEESRELYKENAQLRHEIDSVAENYRKQITSLTQTINDLEKKLIQPKEKDHVDAASDSELENIENTILNVLRKAPIGDFELSDLFGKEGWRSMSPPVRQAIGKRFRTMVKNKVFPRIKLKGKGAGNQLIYTNISDLKSSVDSGRLDSDAEKILSLFTGLKAGHGHTASSIQDETGDHIEIVRMHLDDLKGKKFIRVMGKGDGGEDLYDLLPGGRKYIIENNMLGKIS
jgi:hypothetical protein